jgi:uncharacterized protein (DUF3820 family)
MLDPEEFAETMYEIGRTFMPFGRYGRKEHPPFGVPIYDLPFEYLEWFTHNGGFPSGRLGELLEILYHIKKDGSDEVFEPFRQRAGGRTKLAKPRRKSFRFKE